MITHDDITAIMTELGCRSARGYGNVLGFSDAHGVFVTVTIWEGGLFRIVRWSPECERQLTDAADFRKAAEAVLWQRSTTDD